MLDREPSAGDIFLFMAGAIAATVLLEAIASDFFRHRLRGEPPEVVVLGSALSLLSNGFGVGAAALSTLVLDGWLVWLVGGFVSIAVFLGAAAIEMALADLLVEDAND